MKDSKRVALEELRRYFSGICSSIDILDGKLQSSLNFSGVIISAIAVVTTIASRESVVSWYWVFLVLSILLYFFMFARLRLSVNPINIDIPITIDKKLLKEIYLDELCDEERALDQAIADYIESIDTNSKLMTAKAEEVTTSSWFMFFIILSLVFSVLFGIILPSI